MEAECPKFSHSYLCNKGTNLQLRATPDCVHQLIINQDLQESCQVTTVLLQKPAMEQLDDQHYVVSFPQPTRVQLTCEREDYNLLQGSYLVTIPLNCYLRTAEFTITNDKDEIKGHPLKLTKIPYDVMKQVATPSHVHLKSIDLKGLHNVQSKLLVEPPLTLDTNETNVLYHTTIPLYVIIIGACALVIAIRSRRRNLWNCKLRNAQEAKPTFNQTLEDPEKAENHIDGLPAIFSLNVRK
ncbi:uncharacterized protein LOC113240223 [Hyposmocoma kahamanoa]|uniref:uncharacterized protein LOC113240223 n=1 Tax=Hyposmocoma kahamanoa TaxID=1477025 RepID=UPI000E6D5C14|nr:uncharacterized protein LOC113240223 [Hyposmocoma kahamanoa]